MVFATPPLFGKMTLLEVIDFIAFDVFMPPIMGLLCVLLASIYMWKRAHVGKPIVRSRQGYIIKAVNWTILGLAYFSRAFLPHADWGALLRISFGLLIISEILYNWHHLVTMLRGLPRWKSKML